MCSVESQELAEAVLELVQSPEVVINLSNGLITSVTLPENLSELLSVFVVDWDSQEGLGAADVVEVVGEDGSNLRAVVGEPIVLTATGANDSDRIMEAWRRSQR